MSVQPIIVDEEGGESYQGLRMTADEYMALPETRWSYELINGVVVQQFWGEVDPAGDYPRDRDVYHGVRMTADEYRALGETFERYELINGVVIMSPSPTTQHQVICTEILKQMVVFLDKHPLGIACYEVDVELKDARGEPVMYRPDLVYVAYPRAKQAMERLDFPPDLVVEVVSPHSRAKDTLTKREDYEANGVAEYWLIDPKKDQVTFYRLTQGRYEEVAPGEAGFASQAIPGFVLDVQAVHRKFRSR